MSEQKISYVQWIKEKTFEEFMKVNHDRMREHYDDDSGWVENKMAYIKEQFDEGCDFIFDQAGAEGCKHCEDCEFNQATPDAFGTGDSPTMYECTGKEATECPQVIENINWWFD